MLSQRIAAVIGEDMNNHHITVLVFDARTLKDSFRVLFGFPTFFFENLKIFEM